MASWNGNRPPPRPWNPADQYVQGLPQSNSSYLNSLPHPQLSHINTGYTQQRQQSPQHNSYQHQQPLQNISYNQTPQQLTPISYEQPPNNVHGQQQLPPQPNSYERQPQQYQQMLPDQKQYEQSRQFQLTTEQLQYAPQLCTARQLHVRSNPENVGTSYSNLNLPSSNTSWANQTQYSPEDFDNDSKIAQINMLSRPTNVNNTFEMPAHSLSTNTLSEYKHTQQSLPADNFATEAYHHAEQCVDPVGPPLILQQQPWKNLSDQIDERKLGAEKSQQETDREWVTEWLRKFDKRIIFPAKLSCRTLTIPDAKSLLREALMILKDLSHLHKELCDSSETCTESSWNFRCRRVSTLKARLTEVQSLLLPREKELANKLTYISKKRLRIRKRNAILKEQQAESMQKREELHQQLDTWQNQIHQEDLRHQREKKLKEEADSILAEVRKKQVESTKSLDLIHSLLKLRSLRKDAAQRKGFYTTKESDQLFTAKLATLQSILSKQLEDYRGEEKALRVMLESTREAEQMEKHEQFLLKVADTQQTLSEFLFGCADGPVRDDPIYPFWSFYTQAEGSVDALLNIREEWDSYVVPPDASFGSSVPLGWFAPEDPTSNNWKTALSDTLADGL